MKRQRLIALLMRGFFTAGMPGCGKSSDEKLDGEKKYELSKGEFRNHPAKGYGIKS